MMMIRKCMMVRMERIQMMIRNPHLAHHHHLPHHHRRLVVVLILINYKPLTLSHKNFKDLLLTHLQNLFEKLFQRIFDRDGFLQFSDNGRGQIIQAEYFIHTPP